MRCLLYVFSFVWLILIAVPTHAHEEVMEHKRSNIEVYGNVQFLLRITPEEKFSINFFHEDEKRCNLDQKKAVDTIERILKKNNRFNPQDVSNNRFRIDVDYFSTVDESQHCLVAYELYLTLNISKETLLTDVVEQFYKYENSSPLLKIKGIIHADEDVLDRAFQKEVGKVTQELLDALSQLQDEISRQTK